MASPCVALSDSSRFRYYGSNLQNRSKKGSTRTNYSFTATGTVADVPIETTALQKAPFSVIESGDYGWNAGGLDNRGGLGGHWSSRTYSSTFARSLGFHASHFNPQYGDAKPNGFTVRCVVR